MSVLVTLDLKVKPGSNDDLTSWFKNELHHTRGFEGCNGITVHRNQDDHNNLVIVEDWDSRSQYEKYLSWREERGDVEVLVGLLDGEPKFSYFDNIGV